MKPMLAKKTQMGSVPQGSYLYEIKWDGIRAIITLEDNNLTIHSRSGRDITSQFPDLLSEVKRHTFSVVRGIFDAEIVVFDENRVPDFARVTSRLHLGDHHGIAEGAVRDPATAILFDLLSYNGTEVIDRPLKERRELLEEAVVKNTHWRISKSFLDGISLYEKARDRNLEGIMAKRIDSPYLPGRRTQDWLKVKIMYEETVRVIGYTEGLGKRDGLFGALIVESLDGEPIGRVGTGFTDDELGKITDRLVKCGVLRTYRDEVYLKRKFNVKVRGMKKNKSGAIREPVYLGLA